MRPGLVARVGGSFRDVQRHGEAFVLAQTGEDGVLPQHLRRRAQIGDLLQMVEGAIQLLHALESDRDASVRHERLVVESERLLVRGDGGVEPIEAASHATELGPALDVLRIASGERLVSLRGFGPFLFVCQCLRALSQLLGVLRECRRHEQREPERGPKNFRHSSLLPARSVP